MSVVTDFEEWMASVGIELNTDAIRLVSSVAGCSGLALGVQAVRDIAEGERLCTIPKAACISIRTTGLVDVIEAEELGGGLGLVLAVMHEMSLGADSKWHGYFKALPAREYVPLFWTDQQLQLLKGTELEHKAESDREATKEDFEQHILPLLARYPGRLRPAGCTLEAFHVAAAHVGSRAFGVDEWHGDAMVPLADIFNHKASVVDLAPGYLVHGASSDDEDDDDDDDIDTSDDEDDDDDDTNNAEGGDDGTKGKDEGSDAEGTRHHHHKGCCGGGSGCGHKAGGKRKRTGSPSQTGTEEVEETGRVGEEEGEGSGDDEDHEHEHEHSEGAQSALPSVMGSTQASIYGLKSANGLHLRLEIGIVDRDEDTLEIVAASAVPAGHEVHNTYGELGNAELVGKYGFALRQNPFTAVALDKARLLGAVRAAAGPRRWRQLSALLAAQSPEVLEEDGEPFEVLPNGHIGPALFLALRVVCATDEEASGWASLGDALKLPHAAATAAGAAGAAVAVGAGPVEEESAGKGKGEGKGEGQSPELGAVQVWPALDVDGQPLEAGAGTGAGLEAPAAKAGAAGAASGAAASKGPGGDDGAQQPDQGRGEGQGQGREFAALLTRPMCELLREAVQQRLAAYEAPLEEDLQRLRLLEQQQQRQQQQPPQAQQQQQPQRESKRRKQGGATAAAAAGAEREAAEVAVAEARVAERAALLLRITEKEVLRDLLTAVQRRLAVQPPADGNDGSAPKKNAGKKKAGPAKNADAGRKTEAARQRQGERRTAGGGGGGGGGRGLKRRQQ